MNRWAKLSIYLITAITIICGTVMIYLRGVMPETNGWTIVHETHENNFLRIEKGIVTEDYLGQYVVIVTARQHLDVYINGEVILSSSDYGFSDPVAAKYAIRIIDDFINKEMRIVFSTPFQSDNYLMLSALSFQRINPGTPEIDYSITAVSIMSGIAALILAFAFGIRTPGSGGICLFALMNFTHAFNTIRGDTIIGYDAFLNPRLLLFVSYASFFTYMLPLLFFFFISLTGIWKKFSLALIISTIAYSIAAIALNAAHIIPLGLTDGVYNYVLSLTITLLIVMMALQSKEKNSFSVIARIHLVIWTLWGLSAAIRLLVFDMTLQVNVEYRLMYSFTLLSLTFFGIYSYALRIHDLQERENLMNIKTESLLQNYEQMNTHFHEVNSIKHDIRNHLTALHVLLKDNRYDEAQSYLDKYAIEIGEITEAVYHGNYLINAMMHDFVRQAKEKNIKFSLNLKASPKNIADPDLVSLLTNIIENSFEACEKLPPERERFINLSISRREPYLAITCENSNPGNIKTDSEESTGGKLITSKKKRGHGYGLQTVERLTQTYNGLMDIIYDDEVFSITVALKDAQ